MTNPIIIIGAGLAGYTLAKDLRKLDAGHPIKLITACKGRFYSKPQLSTALTLNKTIDTLTVSDAKTMAEHHNLEVITEAKVSAIDPAQKTVEVNGQRHSYHKLVLALGADMISANLAGDAASEVMAVNHIEHYDNFRQQLTAEKKVVILGAGLVGCEFANDLIKTGHDVTMIAPCDYPLPQLLKPHLAAILQQSLENSGVHWHLDNQATAINHHQDGFQLELASGGRIQADIVLSAIGLVPKVDLAKQANLKSDRGIVVNDYCQSSDADIYALGDCAQMNGRLRQYVAPILHSARALAKTLLGEPTQVSFPVMPIVVKTSICPVVLVDEGGELDWEMDGCRAFGRDLEGRLRGFALVADAVKERVQWVKELGSSKTISA